MKQAEIIACCTDHYPPVPLKDDRCRICDRIPDRQSIDFLFTCPRCSFLESPVFLESYWDKLACPYCRDLFTSGLN